MEDFVSIAAAPSEGFLLKKGSGKSLTSKVVYDEALTAPMAKGQPVGRVELYVDQEKVGEYPLIAVKEVKKISFFAALKMILREFLMMRS